MSTDYTQQNPYFRASNQQILHLRGVTKLHKQGRTIVVVTHDQNIASQAQRIIKLRDGKIVS